MATAAARMHPIAWFKREDDMGALDLTPAFQRRPVWTDEQASYLIDTVLHGLPFPEIYLRSETSAAGKTKYQVVDGQQRLRALLRFGDNDLTLSGGDIDSRLSGKSFEDLGDPERQAFWNYSVVVRDITNASDADIRDLFKRLNIASVNLNDQELRHAEFHGEFIGAMERLAEDSWWLEMHIVNVRNVRRMEDVEYVSELFIAMMAGPQDKKSTVNQYYIDYENEFPEAGKWTKTFRETRDLIESVLEPSGVRAWSGRSEFYSLFHVVSEQVLAGTKWGPKRRSAIRGALERFRRQVDQAKQRDNTRQFSGDVQTYAEAVTRAASDAARRRTRAEILRRLLSADK